MSPEADPEFHPLVRFPRSGRRPAAVEQIRAEPTPDIVVYPPAERHHEHATRHPYCPKCLLRGTLEAAGLDKAAVDRRFEDSGH